MLWAFRFAGTEVPSHSFSVNIGELSLVFRVERKLPIHHMLTELKDLGHLVHCKHHFQHSVSPAPVHLAYLPSDISSALGGLVKHTSLLAKLKLKLES